MSHALLFCIVNALCWAGASLLARAVGFNPWMTTTLISIGTLIPVLPFALGQNFSGASGTNLLIGIGGGILNGIGLLAWYRLVGGASEGLWELGSVLPIAIVLLSVMLVIGSRIFFGEGLTTQKMAGLAFACLAVWFLTRVPA